jgi:hypothetical protein
VHCGSKITASKACARLAWCYVVGLFVSFLGVGSSVKRCLVFYWSQHLCPGALVVHSVIGLTASLVGGVSCGLPAVEFYIGLLSVLVKQRKGADRARGGTRMGLWA